ncbi:NUDIX hydrolase [Pelagerythrobacter marensis]|uniref:NUDIX hydrolase n=1 Tax=Pelagerythrobacter marensis TaxID=543877 RepID=A0A0G3X8Z4_9SPHN|nr:NUDIX domain-containing protein [Pelagerythrobacter marensis]AKM07662.1 NUDIX hydrolase [Pelagerythrobacter marensis]
MNDTPNGPNGPSGIAAATVVVFRKGAEGSPPELLMVTRSRSMSFAGGAAVFPGGRVDQADRDLASDLPDVEDVDEAAHRIAAIRETLEETGLAIGLHGQIDAARARAARALLLESGTLDRVLKATGWTLDLSAVVPFARWYPKNERLPRVFDTRFYLADLGTGAVDVAVDETENTRLFWTTARDALAAADRGDLTVIFPTRRNLERLAKFADFDAALQDCAAFPQQTITPFIEQRDGARWICIPENLGYPVTAELLEGVQRS